MIRLPLYIAAIATTAIVASPTAAAPPPTARPSTFAACAACHKTAAGEKSVMGPSLWAIAGRKAGTAPAFAYSPAMKKAGIVWTRATLIAFITSPRKVVPGNRMAYGGQANPKTAAEIADYLVSLK